MFAIVLIVVGLVFLLKNLGIITNTAWDIIWPIFFIVGGIAMLVRRNRGVDCLIHGCCDKKDE